MQNFRLGDVIEILKNEKCSCIIGEEYEVVLDMFGNLCVVTECGYNYDYQNWKMIEALIQPKERTIEEVEVGDVIYKKTIEWNVLGRLGGLLFLSKDKEDGSYFVKLGFLKDNGWKIKKPEPEKKEYIDEPKNYYHYDTSEYEIIPCPDNKPGCLVLHYKNK